METRRVVLLICFVVIVAESMRPVYAQLDTLGFPLDIGTKWFFRYTSKTSPAPYVRVMAIVDTTLNGTRIVRVTRLHSDSTLATERWIVKNGSFHVDLPPDLSNPGVPIYISSLSRDTAWGSYGSSFSYGLKRVRLFGSNLKSQTFSYHYTTLFSEFNRAYGVALGVGIFYHYYHTWGGESTSWTESGTLIGLLKDGRLYGDSLLTAVENSNSFGPLTFKLEQNYPNPFNPSTNIKFQTSHTSHVTLKVYNLQGQEVVTLTDAKLPAGEHQVVFTPVRLANGVYFYRLESGFILLTRKMLLME